MKQILDTQDLEVVSLSETDLNEINGGLWPLIFLAAGVAFGYYAAYKSEQ